MQLDLSDAAVAATTFVRFALAFLLGALIGFERQYRQRTAGLRTNVLVAVGAAAFAEIGMRLLVNYVNRLPIDERVTEALYRVHVVADPEGLPDVRDALASELEALDYPIRDIDLLSESEEQVELAAALVPTTANPGELDRAVLNLEKQAVIRSATWTVGTTT